MAYTAKDITVLEGLEPVRKRPGMYIGSTDEKGLHHILTEIVDNSVDEAIPGFAKNIWVTLAKDGSATVVDDGRGIPIDKHKFGASAVNALSQFMQVIVKRDKQMVYQRYQRGKPTTKILPLKTEKELEKLI